MLMKITAGAQPHVEEIIEQGPWTWFKDNFFNFQPGPKFWLKFPVYALYWGMFFVFVGVPFGFFQFFCALAQRAWKAVQEPSRNILITILETVWALIATAVGVIGGGATLLVFASTGALFFLIGIILWGLNKLPLIRG